MLIWRIVQLISMGYCSEPPVDHVSKAIIGTIIRKYSISTNMEIYNENRIGIYIYIWNIPICRNLMLVKQCHKPSIFLDCLYIHIKMVNLGRVDLIALLTLYIYICIYIYICFHVCVYVYMYICIYVYIYILLIPSIDQYWWSVFSWRTQF